MTKVSKHLLKTEVEKRMFDVFWKSIADLHTPVDVEDFLRELLTPTEQIMLAKRLAISILLTKKYTYVEIIDLLKVSPVTIGTVARWLKVEGKAFRRTISKILSLEKQAEFWDNLEQFLSSLIPPKRGTVWKKVRGEQFQKLKERRYNRSLL
jgi:uncharacterized protein YerC